MEEITHREYLMLLEWMDSQWNEPDRTDHYLMQVSAEIVNSRPRKRGQRRKGKSATDMKLKFVRQQGRGKKSGIQTDELKKQKALWKLATGITQKKVASKEPSKKQ